jgi:cob(I)alamin adenosyltransferase
MKSGIIQIYTGNGKGKTTAAVGAAVRAVGSGLKVVFFQFLKSGKTESGEEKVLKTIKGIKYIKFSEVSPLFERSVDMAKLSAKVKADLQVACKMIDSGKYDMAVLDEVLHLINLELIGENEILEMLGKTPEHVELILTGRDAGRKIRDAAGLITEMKEVKHPFNAGMKARKGIEY